MCVNFPIPADALATTTRKRQLYEETSKVINLLRSTLKIDSESKMTQLTNALSSWRQHLPGPCTIEKLVRLDVDPGIDWTNFARNEYSDVINMVLKLFDNTFPMAELDETIVPIFTIDHNYEFVSEALLALTNKNVLRHKPVTALIKAILESDSCLFASFVDASLDDQDLTSVDKGLRMSKLKDLQQCLIAIPNLVANVYEGDFDPVFVPFSYVGYVLSNIVKAIYFLGQYKLRYEESHVSLDFVGQLLSKVVVNFNESRKSSQLLTFLKILGYWTTEHPSLYATIFDVFVLLERQSVEILSFMMVTQEDPYILCLLDLPLLESNNWSYNFCTKIPFNNHFSEDVPVKNLIHLLHKAQKHQQSSVLTDLCKQLVIVWSSRSSTLTVETTQHLYVSKLLILSVTYLMKAGKISPDDRSDISQGLFNGIKYHLESPDQVTRAIGMICSEVIYGLIHEQEDEKLAFEYENFSPEVKMIVEELKTYPDLYSDVVTIEDRQEEFDPVKALSELKQGTTELIPRKSVSVKPLKVQESEIVDTQVTFMEATGSTKFSLVCPPKIDQDSDELDSDDDLVPYDMTNDTAMVEAKAPKFLIDLIDGILKEDDPETFKLCVETASTLVKNLLPKSDSTTALKLLEIFITLDQKSFVENFEMNRFNACLSICMTFPKECAQYLCNEFYAEVSKYNYSTRILILDILGETAKQLAKNDIKVTATDVSGQSESKRPKLWQESEWMLRQKEIRNIINERLMLKTRRFASTTPNDSEKGTVNKFNEVAGWFFFPLVRGFGKHQFIFKANTALKDNLDYTLLIAFVHTLAIVIISAENCPIAHKFAAETFNLALLLRFNEQPKVRLAVLHLLATVFMTIKSDLLMVHFYHDIFELQEWLKETLETRKMNEECHHMAEKLMIICVNCLSQQ